MRCRSDCPSCKGSGWVCEDHQTIPAGDCPCGAAGKPCQAEITVGCYVRPDDASDDASAIHSLEGTCWAIERLPNEETGELVDHLHVVHVQAGQLRWSMLPATRIGSVDPPHLADLDSLLKLSGKQLQKTGRRTETRVLSLVHAVAGVLAQPQHQPDMPSVFRDDPDEPVTPRPVCGSCGRPTRDDICPVHGAATPNDPVAALVARFQRLGGTEQNEVRRTARAQQLTYLEDGAALTLADQVAYDTALARWERHGQRAAS